MRTGSFEYFSVFIVEKTMKERESGSRSAERLLRHTAGESGWSPGMGRALHSIFHFGPRNRDISRWLTGAAQKAGRKRLADQARYLNNGVYMQAERFRILVVDDNPA